MKTLHRLYSEDRYYMWVTERSSSAGLEPEPLDECSTSESRRRNDLDRYGAIERKIERKEYRRHSTAAEMRIDVIIAESR